MDGSTNAVGFDGLFLDQTTTGDAAATPLRVAA
jgi:hypothetical protein